MAGEWRSDRREKFKILHRDNFTCRYCGARPGSENLEIDHLIPRSRYGSDNPCNLVTACVTCNGRKSDTVIFPASMIERDDEDEGWKIHKSFGVWAVKFNDVTVVIENRWGWWFEAHWLVTDFDFVKYHLPEKLQFWEQGEPETASDFMDCVRYVEKMLSSRQEKQRPKQKIKGCGHGR
jgi:hypothetical protein